jgi:hypothetical protein
MFDALIAWLARVLDAPPVETGDHLCDLCRNVYDGVHRCASQVVGFCVDCRHHRLLDKFGNCENCGSRSVTGRTFLNGSTSRLDHQDERATEAAVIAFPATRKAGKGVKRARP